MNGNAARTTIWLWLTAPVAILLAIAAGSELLVDGLFRGDATNFVAQAIGQDFVTQAVAFPALVVSSTKVPQGEATLRAWHEVADEQKPGRPFGGNPMPSERRTS